MIVTRRRRKPFPFKRLLLPLIAIVLIAIAFVWPPSRAAIFHGPLSPVFNTVGGAYAKVAAPFSFAAQARKIGDQDKAIATLQSQLTAAQNDAADKKKQLATLQSQIDQLQAQAAAARGSASPGPKSSGAPNAAGAPSAGVLGQTLTPAAQAELRRTGSYWTSMDPGNAAKVVQRLPPSYVAQVFTLMSADAVGSILDDLPPAYAAKLTQANPTIQR